MDKRSLTKTLNYENFNVLSLQDFHFIKKTCPINPVITHPKPRKSVLFV